jgi:hypothetical protein
VNSCLSAVPEAQPSGAAEDEAGIWDAEGVTGEDFSGWAILFSAFKTYLQTFC